MVHQQRKIKTVDNEIVYQKTHDHNI